MLPLTLLNSLMLSAILLTLCALTATAPTHHLTIGVQGNTPTLIVTSSEIGITPETLNPNKKSLKSEFLPKPQKDLKSNEKHKPLKQKIHKNFSVNNKKEKLQYFAKPIAKQNLFAESTTEKIQSLSLSEVKHFEQPLEYKNITSTKQLDERKEIKNISTVTFKSSSHSKVITDMTPEQQQTEEIILKISTTIQPKAEENENKNTFKMSTQDLKDIDAISIIPTKTTFQVPTSVAIEKLDIPTILATSPPKTEVKQKQSKKLHIQSKKEEEEDDNTENNFNVTTPDFKDSEATSMLPPKSIYEVSTSVAVEKLDIPTILATSLPRIEEEQEQSKALPDITSTVATFSQKAEDFTTNMEFSNKLGSKKFDDISTSTIHDIVTTSETLKTSSTLKAKSTSDFETTTVRQITEESTTTIKTEKDNDRATKNPSTTLKNENLLLHTTPTMAKPDTASPTPTWYTTSITDNAAAATTTTTSMPLLSISLTTISTTIVNDVDVNNEQTAATETTETATNMKKADSDVVDEAESDDVRSIVGDNNRSVKTKQELTYEKSKKVKLSPTSGILSHTRAKTMTTKKPLPSMTVAQIKDLQINVLQNVQSVIKTEADMEIEVPTTSIPINEQKQPAATTEISLDSLETTSTTTEKVLKLIDLEKHVVASIDELHQPSLTVGSSHDNGHDGLKNIKKKQLIDKHYIEDLLLNKHDDNHKSKNYQKQNVSHIPPSALANSTTSLSHMNNAAATSHLLVPIKHGYLGPILMEEKTFHVIHHADNIKHDAAKKASTLSTLETKLRNGHFVELKAKPDMITSKPDISKHSLESTAQSDKEQIIEGSIGKTAATKIISQNQFRYTEDLNNNGGLTITENTRNSSQRLKENGIPKEKEQSKSATVFSSTLFQIVDTVATKTPIMPANTTFTSENIESMKESKSDDFAKAKTESKISDIQIEVYDSTVDSIISSTNFKDNENNPIFLESVHDDFSQGKTTKPPVSSMQQEKFTQYVIDRTETSTQESINFSRIKVASGKPEPAAIEIHINVSESFGNESEDLEFSYPQSEYNNNERAEDESYDDSKTNDNIKLKVPANGGSNSQNKDARSDEILVVEIVDTDNATEQINHKKFKTNDDLFISDNTPPPPPPPPPYQSNFDRDSDTIFYISNTEVKVGESLATPKNSNEERKLKLESQFFPANYMASTHPNLNTNEDSKPLHHLYEEDIILSSNSNRNQADSLKIYRNRNEPSPPLDVTYVGESIIEVEQSPDSGITTTYAPDQQHLATQQADVIIQPAILPEISIGVPVIGELPPQIELKEIDFMPNEAQLHRSGIYDENDGNNNNNNIYNNDIEDNTINAGSIGYGYSSHDVDNNNNQRLDESSIQYGGDLIDESADGGFDGVEGSYPFGNPAAAVASSTGLTRTRKQKPNHVADYAHLYVNYGVNNMRKDELSADVKDSAEIMAVGVGGVGNIPSVNSNEQNITSFKDFLNRVSMNNSSFINGNFSQTERMSNATAFSVMEDANDLQEKNTEDIVNLISLAIGLFIVILPIVVTCSMFWALRYLYKKYHSNITDSCGYSDQNDTKGQMNEDGVEKGELIHDLPSSSPTNSNKDAIQKLPDTSNKPSTTDSTVKFSTVKSTHLDQTSSNTAGISSSASKAKFSLQLSLALEKHTTEIHTVHDEIETPGPNGSITKMTLENNLLIVETEERNDISRVARETKMDYNKDGVFVVEVARGIDSKTIPESPVAEDSEKMLSMFETKHNNGTLGYKVSNEKNCLNNEKVQIHSPPPENSSEDGPRSLHQIEEVDEPINSPHLYGEDDADIIAGLAYKSQVGLSQSDLSTTSSNDSNKGYCYGNQALYVVEQNGYSTMSPTGNVILKCDSKDIKDEDHNPENDHYLENSPDKTEDRRDNDDFVETLKKQENSGKRPDQETSPQQKQNDKETEENCNDITYSEEEIDQLNICQNVKDSSINNASNDDNPTDSIHLVQASRNEITIEEKLSIDLDILVVNSELENLPSSLPIQSSSPFKSTNPQELIPCDETYSVTEISLTVEPAEGDEALPVTVESVLMVEESITNSDGILAVPEKFSDYGQTTDNEIDKSITSNGTVSKIITKEELIVSENGCLYTEKITMELNGIAENSNIEINSDEESRTENKLNSLAEDKIAANGHYTEMNGLETLNDPEIELQANVLQNGNTDSGPPSNSLTDMENGYDSIMSLPEPPPTTEDQLNSDLSEQQLDSLPPPPPPEIFNLKDLPPPQTNGDTDSLPSEDSTNFYNTLPPPPPTTLTVNVPNGRMHASPLTPPASPPAHFTNNLHAGLCAQPIAVDVNGS